jgi:hypothetical protein
LTLLFVREDPAEPSTVHLAKNSEKHPGRGAAWPAALRTLTRDVLRPQILLVALFIALWNFNPFSSTVLQWYMTTELKLSEQFYGETIALEAVGAMAGTICYGFYCRRVPLRWLLQLSIASGVLATLAYWGLRGPTSARLVVPIVGFTYITGLLVQLDVAARVCSQSAAATTFALLMALSNISVTAAIAVGGALYNYWEAAVEGHFAFRALVATGAATTAACWFLVPWLRRVLKF